MLFRANEESATVQVVVQLMAKQTGTVRQIPRAGKLQTGKILHMDSVPLLLDADDEMNTLERLCVSNLATHRAPPSTPLFPEGAVVDHQGSPAHAGP
jgi:hypothetical protein